MISFFLCIHTILSPVATMREQPTSDSRVASQAIFAEEVKVLEEKGEYVLIETCMDHYQGWTQKEAVGTAEKAPQTTVTVNRLAAHVYGVTDTEFGPIITLPFESRLELVAELPEQEGRWLKVRLPNNTCAFIQRGDVAFSLPKQSRDRLVEFSKQFLGLPYTWGGRSSFGYDCSGFVQMLYRQMGIFLPRDSKDQMNWRDFRAIEIGELQPCDLIFFGKNEQKITHMGMYIGDGKFIHACAGEKKPYLRISSLTDDAWDGKSTNKHPYRAARTLQ